MIRTALVLALTAAIGNFYPKTMVVTDLNYEQDTVTCIDSSGYIWEFYGTEDYTGHDMVSCIMYDNGTEAITDDMIISVQYSGYRK